MGGITAIAAVAVLGDGSLAAADVDAGRPARPARRRRVRGSSRSSATRSRPSSRCPSPTDCAARPGGSPPRGCSTARRDLLGADPRATEPARVIGLVEPVPLLLIHGEADTTVPIAEAGVAWPRWPARTPSTGRSRAPSTAAPTRSPDRTMSGASRTSCGWPSRRPAARMPTGRPTARAARYDAVAGAPSRPTDRTQRSSHARGGLMAAKILVVDDDANVQRLLQYTLKQEGYDVVIAPDGAEGFRLWGAEAPDLILLDVQLPKLDGYQVAAKIRSEEGGSSHVPIIMLTAEREVEQKVRGLRAGADDYLIKPFHPAELLARIKSLLARFAPRDALAGPPADGPHPGLLRGQGRRGHDDHRHQRGHRPASRARAQGRPRRRQPAVRRPPRVPRPRARQEEHRRHRDRAVDRRRARPPGHGQARLGGRPAARAAVAGDRRARPSGAPAAHRRAADDDVRLHPRRRRQAPRRRQPRRVRGGRDRSSWS